MTNFPNYRDPNKVFDAAIRAGVLSDHPDADNYAADWMYMGDNAEGKALFKNIVSRSYMPPVDLKVAA
jgi:hypothetical protein